MQNFEDAVQGKHCLNLVLNRGGGRKNVRFLTENWPYLENNDR